MPALLQGRLLFFTYIWEAYPEVKWKIWKFGRPVPEKFWNSFDNQKLFLEDLAVTLHLQNMEDWYSVTVEMIRFERHSCVTI